MVENVAKGTSGEPDSAGERRRFLSSLNVSDLSNQRFVVNRVITSLQRIVNRFSTLQPCDPAFEPLYYQILRNSKEFLSVFNQFLEDEDNSGFFEDFMARVYRPFIDKISDNINIRIAAERSVKLFEATAGKNFLHSRKRPDFRRAAEHFGSRYIPSLATEIKISCLSVFKAVDKERAEIDQLTGVYCRRRTFELFRQLFNEHIPNDDFDEGADAYSDGSCGSLDYFEFSGSADDADSCPYVDPLFVAGGEEDIDGYYDESVVDDVDVFGDSDGCPESSVKSLAFVFIDLDHFKLVNDIYGHSIGDRVLKIFGRVLKKIVRSTDIVGRFGGEEFVLALNNVTFEEAVWVCSRLRDETNKALREDEDLVSVCPEMVEKGLTASVGISFRGHNNELSTAEGHVNSADVAAYAVKRSGRDGIVYIKENKLYRIKSIRQLKDGDRIAGYEIEEEEILLAEVEPSSVGTIVGDDKFVIMNGKTYKVTVTSSQGRIINIVGEEVSDLSAPLSLDVFDEGGGI